MSWDINRQIRPIHFHPFADLINRHLIIVIRRIEDLVEDRILAPGNQTETLGNGTDGCSSDFISINNWDLLRDEELKEKILRGEVLQRSTRWSLTCRDVERVSKNLQRLRGTASPP